MSCKHLTEIYHTEDDENQRYVATDPASELHVFLRALGLPDDARRAAVTRILAIVGREREQRCTRES